MLPPTAGRASPAQASLPPSIDRPTFQAPLARSGTLSWQQRPSSQGSNSSRSRPLSASNPVATSPQTRNVKESDAAELSRSEIADSLASKDPAWFRQTSDRGLGSAAFRKNQVEEETDTQLFNSRPSRQLPGMSGKAQPNLTELPTLQQPGISGRTSPTRHEDESGRMDFRSRTPQPVEEKIAIERRPSPAVNAPTLEPRSSSSLDMHVDRAPSPTKGLGGFVQSAMMKRSDSVNKRWNVQANAGLKRGDSVAGARGSTSGPGLGRFGSVASRSPTRASRAIGSEPPSSPLSSSRPNSSYAAGDLVRSAEEPLPKFVEPRGTLPTSPSSDPIASETGVTRSETFSDHELPVSPTKTYDTRRWSPTKASWLESALTRPESPKPVSQRDDQPAWKADLQRSKHARPEGDDSDRSTVSHEVASPARLLQSPPLNVQARPLSISGLPEGFSSGLVKKPDPSPIKADISSTPAATPSSAVVSSQASTSSFTNAVARESRDKQKSEAESQPVSKSSSHDAQSRTPPFVKPKPQTPPKIDFRSGLKSRQNGNTGQDKSEPEFKAVFGKLKKTETKNYVAPDELKDNILRGKSGLSLTGGPQKSSRVDEFKESILQKKESMKASSTKPTLGAQSQTPPKPEKPSIIPEALARRQTLKQAGSMTTESAKPARRQADNIPSTDVVSLTPSKPAPYFKQQEQKSTQISSKPTGVQTVPTVDSSSKPQAPAAAATPVLAARINPSMAAIMTRSKSPALSSSQRGAVLNVKSSLNEDLPSAQVKAESNANLTHMTKGRARGPKRRLPQAETTTAPNTITSISPVSEKAGAFEIPLRSMPRLQPVGPVSEVPARAIGIETVRPKDSSVSKESETSIVNRPISEKPYNTSRMKPIVATKSPELRKVSSPPMEKAPNNVATPIDVSQEPPQKSPSKPLGTIDSPARPQRDLPATPSKPFAAKPLPLSPSTTKLNSPKLQPPQSEHSPYKSKLSAKGLGLNFDQPLVPKAAILPSTHTPPLDKYPPPIGKPQTHVDTALTDFFGQSPQIRDKGEFDTQSIMQSVSSGEAKLKNTSVQIWEISGDGKKQPLPSQQEHILFEECMYLCVQIFQNATGSKGTNVYLWRGDGVSEGAVEDAQLFCRKTARENSAKLEVIKQGKEPASFFLALGGILIIRRTKSSALYMLCGRRHLGHVVFDEVDSQVDSLCSAYPYIVSAKFGKLYLWKGIGSAADELGCARLIGMDLGLTGEIEEVEEGREPPSFFEALGTPKRKTEDAADFWGLKSMQEHYCCRLYRIEHDRPRSAGGAFWGGFRGSSPPKSSNKALVQEILPYRQDDLEADHIYVLDAYMRIYV